MFQFINLLESYQNKKLIFYPNYIPSQPQPMRELSE